MRKPSNYFERRSTELMLRLEHGTEKTIDSLIQAYEQATKNINKEIARIYKNYSKEGVLKEEALKKLLTKQESDLHYKNLLKVINNIKDEDIKKKLLVKYNAPAYSYRISRYEALQENINAELKRLAEIEQQVTETRYIDTIKEGYYHSIYDIQKGTGLGFSFAQIDNKTINLMLNENWTPNPLSGGANFSKRIWNNSETLGNYLRTNLTADSMSGKSIAKISKELSEFMNVGLFYATRLVRTEVNHFANEAEMLSYEELEIEKYRFIATLDIRTCERCAKLDNQIFNVKDRKPGKNYPPIHANDRCTTVAVFDDEITEELRRSARDENGNSMLVLQDMSYKEWKEKYVTNNDINKPQYIKSSKIIKNIEISKEIDKSIKLVSNKVYKMLIGTKFEESEGNSYYDRKNDIIYVSKDTGIYDIIHEIGHLVETKQKIMYNETYINIQKDGIGEVKKNEIKPIAGYPKQNGKDILFIPEKDKFLSEYQRRIYDVDIKGKPYYSANGFNTETLGDYFSEGYRYYIIDKELVKQKDERLYKFIKELVE